MTNHKVGTIKQCPDQEFDVTNQTYHKIVKLCVISFCAGGLFVAAIFGLVTM